MHQNISAYGGWTVRAPCAERHMGGGTRRQVTTAGCGCANKTQGCCDHIASPLTDKVQG